MGNKMKNKNNKQELEDLIEQTNCEYLSSDITIETYILKKLNNSVRGSIFYIINFKGLEYVYTEKRKYIYDYLSNNAKGKQNLINNNKIKSFDTEEECDIFLEKLLNNTVNKE
jgi:hypothetical protein